MTGTILQAQVAATRNARKCIQVEIRCRMPRGRKIKDRRLLFADSIPARPVTVDAEPGIVILPAQR